MLALPPTHQALISAACTCCYRDPAAGNQLYAAHCGDTRAVMSRNGEALRLTEDHKPNLPRERKRVEVRLSHCRAGLVPG